MPADASIYGQQQPFKINTPFENLSNVLQVRAQQQQIRSNQALEQERRAKLAEDRRAQQEADAYYKVLAGPGTTDERLEAIRTNPLTAKFYAPTLKSKQEADKSAADAKHVIAQAAKAHADAMTAIQEHQAGQAQKVIAAGYDPQLFIAIGRHELELFPDLKDELGPALAQVQAAPPDQQKALVQQIMQGWGHSTPASSNAMTAAGPPKTVQPGEGVRNAQGGYDVPLPKPAPEPTTASMDARYQDLVKKQVLKQPLTSDESAEMKAYQVRKLLGPEAAAANAANQQARAISAQVAQQGRAQDFTEKQAGRVELTTKIEQPYLDAKEKADTLRSVIAASRNGNMMAGSVQSLLGVLGLVTMEGVKRINTTELNQVEGAGSLLERLRGAMGKVVSGQPLSPKIQSDLEELSNVLEKSAEQKYVNGFNTVTKRYRLDDEKPLVRTAAPANPGSGAPPNETPDQRIKRLLGGG